MATLFTPDPSTGMPVAQVIVDSGLAHLDHPFDYLVPAQLSTSAVVGARVRVPFAGRDLDGFVVGRAAPAHPGRLTEIRRVVSPEPVLTQELLGLCRAVARMYAGSLGDVLRLAVPKRHAAAERALPLHPEHPPGSVPDPGPGPWAAYPAGPAYLRRVAAGEAPAAAWLALPGRPAELDWPMALATAAAAALAGGRGALLVVPDHRDVERVDTQLTALLGRGQHVRLTADQGPQARYTAWLKLLRGHARCVVGTRAAAFAPVRDLGLVAWWDDGDDLFEEPRAPYPQVRDVLALRSSSARAAMLTGGFARSVAVQRWVESGRVQPLDGPTGRRGPAARVVVAGEDHTPGRDGAAARARLAPQAWQLAQQALAHGPVLVQVPRRGYVPSLTCHSCRSPIRCPACHGPLALPGLRRRMQCHWCAGEFVVGQLHCPHCDDTRVRSAVVGAGRTAEELGRAFPSVSVLTSSAGTVLARVPAGPALVVATPGAEPVADGGYAAALLLDAWALLDRSELDASVEALRRWLTAAALVRPAAAGGVVVLAGTPDGPRLPAVEALARWDPAWLAARELTERRQLRLPPAAVLARIVGERRVVAGVVDAVLAELGAAGAGEQGAGWVESGEVGAVEHLGPILLPDKGSGAGVGDLLGVGGPAGAPEPVVVQSVVRVPLSGAAELARAVRAARAGLSARKQAAGIQVRMHWNGS